MIKNILLTAVLIIGASVTATAGNLNKYDSKALFSLLTDYGVHVKRMGEIVELETAYITCEESPANRCSIEPNAEMSMVIEVNGKDAQTLSHLLIDGGATQNLARLPATVTAQSVSCTSGGIVPAGIVGPNCTVVGATIAE